MDDNKPVVLSPEGLKKLQDELEYLRITKRKEVADRLREARSYGDLSENSEYDDARNEQAFVEGRITMLENTLRNAVVIDDEAEETAGAGGIRLGSTVVLKDLEYGDLLEYTIVGTVEADPSQNKISNESPVGKAIMGKSKGAVVEVEAPVGHIKYEIVDVK